MGVAASLFRSKRYPSELYQSSNRATARSLLTTVGAPKTRGGKSARGIATLIFAAPAENQMTNRRRNQLHRLGDVIRKKLRVRLCQLRPWNPTRPLAAKDEMRLHAGAKLLEAEQLRYSGKQTCPLSP